MQLALVWYSHTTIHDVAEPPAGRTHVLNSTAFGLQDPDALTVTLLPEPGVKLSIFAVQSPLAALLIDATRSSSTGDALQATTIDAHQARKQIAPPRLNNMFLPLLGSFAYRSPRARPAMHTMWVYSRASLPSGSGAQPRIGER